MKQILLFLLLCFVIDIADAQNSMRRVRFHAIDRDSINLSLNDEYYLIEDSCAQIIRYSRFNFETRKFFGKFKDVSRLNPGMVVSEGSYSSDGLKEGAFISHYLNGNLQAKGNFKNNKYDGRWEMYYQDGKPELTFEVIDGNYQIIDAWGADGKKTVDNGNGVYIDNFGEALYWNGKLVNGKPDGKWNLIKTDDISNTPVASERFKKGQFHDGSTGAYDYSDVSHITLVDPFKLPLVNAEKMRVSAVPCGGVRRKHIIGAQYKDGLRFFTKYIGDAVSPYFSRVNLKGRDVTIDIEGEISEAGDFVNLKSPNSTAGDLSNGLISRLRTLPPLNQATADGVPIRQKFVISFIIRDGWYQYTYRFLPIKTD